MGGPKHPLPPYSSAPVIKGKMYCNITAILHLQVCLCHVKLYVLLNVGKECGTRGVVEWLIKHEAKPSALSDMRPQPVVYCYGTQSMTKN